MVIERLHSSRRRARGDSTEILILEDDGLDTDRLSRMIGRLPGPRRKILRAGRLSEALELLALHNPDVALVDPTLTGVPGVQVVETVASCAPDCAVIELGAQDYLQRDVLRWISHHEQIKTLRRMWDLAGPTSTDRGTLEPNRLLDTIRTACVALTPRFEVVGGSILVDVDESLTVAAKPDVLHEVLAIILTNSITYRRDDIPLSVQIDAARGETITIRVVDNGLGIPTESSERVFEAFERLDPTRADGLGLGLPIARRLVEQAGGSIRIEPNDEPGTAALIELSLDAPCDGR